MIDAVGKLYAVFGAAVGGGLAQANGGDPLALGALGMIVVLLWRLELRVGRVEERLQLWGRK